MPEGMEELGVRMGFYIKGYHCLHRVSGEGPVGGLSHTQKGAADTQNVAEKPLFSHGERIK